MDLQGQLYKQIIAPHEIESALDNINRHLAHLHRNCFKFCTNHETASNDNQYETKIDSIIDYLHDELNTGHWSNIPIEVRRAFTAASVVKALVILHSQREAADSLKEALKSIDMGLLLGAPLLENSELLNKWATKLSKEIAKIKPNLNNVNTSHKRKHSLEIGTYNNVNGQEVDVLICPSVDVFNTSHFLTQKPVKLKDCISHWPAMTNWTDVNYFLRIAGERTVPVEIGSHYTDENWSQKLMLLKDFVGKYFLEESNETGYLAQHNLFDQITELRDDIRVPDYCCLSKDYKNSCDVDINAWFGPKGTVSPLHYDPKDNLLAQVFGTKQIILFPPEDSINLYPHDDKLLLNTAQVNPVVPDFIKFPLLKKAKMYKCLLEAGDMLFIPAKWWHHVTALEKSFSVSFWWQ